MGTTARHSSAHKLGKFFTSPPTAAACLAHLAETLPGLNADLFLEPSAGSLCKSRQKWTATTT